MIRHSFICMSQKTMSVYSLANFRQQPNNHWDYTYSDKLRLLGNYSKNSCVLARPIISP